MSDVQQGDPCPRCGASLGVYATRVRGDVRIRYLGCTGCPYKPPRNKVVVPLRFAPLRTAEPIDNPA